MNFAEWAMHSAAAQDVARNDAKDVAKRPTRGRKRRRPDPTDFAHMALCTVDDIKAAIAWRLDRITANELAALFQVLRPFAADFRGDRPELAAILADSHQPYDERSSWSLACAVLAQNCDPKVDQFKFAVFGFEVVLALRQAHRGVRNKRLPTRTADSLDTLIVDTMNRHPDMKASDVFDCFKDLVWRSPHKVLADFDENKDVLVCQLDPGSEALTDVSRSEIAKRINR